jgi:hypothetical protein
MKVQHDLHQTAMTKDLVWLLPAPEQQSQFKPNFAKAKANPVPQFQEPTMQSPNMRKTSETALKPRAPSPTAVWQNHIVLGFVPTKTTRLLLSRRSTT